MIKGIVFANQKVPAAAHGAIFNSCLSDGVLYGCSVNYIGSTVNIGTGAFIGAGRALEIISTESLTMTQNSGYARIKGVINTANVSTETQFNQFSWGIDYASSTTGFPALTQANINAEGTVYEFEFCVVSLGSGGVTGITRAPRRARGRAVTATATLTVAGWSGGSQTVTVQGVDADSTVFTSPAAASWLEARDSGVRCSGQGMATLTFTTEDTPTTALTYNVAILN